VIICLLSLLLRSVFGPLLVALLIMVRCLFASDHSVAIESPETKVSLVELFTSEGCSSCPRAEKWLGELKGESGLWNKFVPIAFHVDYWNHLGWRDRFSSPEFTRRQRDYAARWNATTIYTPAFVVDGEEWLRASLPPPSREKPGKLRLVVEKERAQMEVWFFSNVNTSDFLVADVVPLAHGVGTNVERGENAGRQLRHDFVALALLTASLERSGDRVYRAQVTLPVTMAAPIGSIAAWVRPANSLIPIQAAGGWLSERTERSNAQALQPAEL
jgi:hypothetical protein